MKAQKDLHIHRTQSECTAAETNEEPPEYRLRLFGKTACG